MKGNGLKLRWTGGGIAVLYGVALLGMTVMTPAVAAGSMSNASIAKALKGEHGQIKFNVRYRWEHVSQDGKKTTNGDPLRLRLGYLTPRFANLQAYAEFEGDTAVFADNYNDKLNGKTSYAVIADPDSRGELNQGWLAFTGIPGTTVRVGRQRIILDNARFVGNVGWRQMEQTYDAGRVINTAISHLTLDATYIWNVRNILSKNDNMSSYILNAGYKIDKIGKVTAYSYLLDYDDSAKKSSQTVGLRLGGAFGAARNLKILYLAEYARQSDYQNNPNNFAANYYHLSGGFKVPVMASGCKNFVAKIGYEFQGADNGVSFQTPLGTNHAFGGWVDKFLATPPNGLEDLYGMVAVNFMGTTAKLFYHTFAADLGNADYGNEFDVMLKHKINRHYAVLTGYGSYNADQFSVDTDKFWLQMDVNF